MGEATPLSELDEELLELLTLPVPWHMVCADFHERYGSPGALVRRLFELRGAGLIDVAGGEDVPTPEALEADALANRCYADLDRLGEPQWDLVATERGHSLVRDRLAGQ